MNDQLHTEELRKVLDTTKSVFVLLPQNPSLDATASALALFLSLKEAGKTVFVGCPTQMRVEYKNLVGVDRISDKIGNRNLIISFDYQEDAIEKVSYNVEEGKFNLVIEPKSGNLPLDSKGVNFAYEGMEAKLIFVIGAKKLEDLTKLYEKDRQAFTETTIVNIDSRPGNTNFGQINITEPGAASISEVMFQLMKKLNLPINVDIAGNLLKGIETQTQYLQAPFAGPDTFEAVAQLLRAGAKRAPSQQAPMRPWMGRPQVPPMPGYQVQSQRLPPLEQTAPPIPAPTILSEPKLDIEESSVVAEQGDLTRQTQGATQFKQPAPLGETQVTQSPSRQIRQNQSDKGEPGNNREDTNVQNDWLKPKIYKGSTRS
ncbi:MAG: hypothetical protein A2785_00025 [Candidatus Chisholmbacteria bacterium RIFCSPHIGHO2_01_FULL_49_18]|uniref:DDH domain-containing protein n=2 Tax=Candidatus Chisholmiibacteriota TaxID=1817900 RepID=A0A1G1VLR4_9BACT|nr:MAG: hypothetical protein A2785_00025 [Candidatus Chisholmbacteria bacterium RIFCSPHIGHO2_01_FULL_49_18]OGY19350.1 MAG: hypothetical protein A3A65_03725 [Candidatus Chisholmbacteria bacterium RIFCSPLOWO2_01_FULL_49_14]